MAQKQSKAFPSKQRDILNFRPDIHFVEPRTVEDTKIPSVAPVTLDAIKQDVQSLTDGYQNVQDQVDALQKQVDDKAKNVVIHLDEQKDAAVLAAVRRHFNDPTKSTITYDDYTGCINDINTIGAQNATTVDPNDIITASTDQYRDSFGSLNLPSGLARPELASHAQTVPPLNMAKFTAESLAKLMEELTDPITSLIIKEIKKLNPF